MIGSKAILLALLALFNISLLSCQSSNTYYTDFSRLITQKIPPRQAKRNLYPLLKTDLNDTILSDLHYSKDGGLLIKSNEDVERNSFIFRFDPSTGKIVDKSEKIYNFGGYEGENRHRYHWDGKGTLDKLWSFELPQDLWVDQTKARSFFHPKLFSDSLHCWLILQQTSSLVSDKTFMRSYLLGIDKTSGKLKSELCLNEEKTVEEWQMLEDRFLISFDQGLASVNKADQKIQWQYHWKHEKDWHTKVRLLDSFVFLLSYRQPNHQQILLRTISKTGKLIPIASFEDKPELLEKMESNEPGFFVPPYDLFVIPRKDHIHLVLSNRGEVFQYEP